MSNCLNFLFNSSVTERTNLEQTSRGNQEVTMTTRCPSLLSISPEEHIDSPELKQISDFFTTLARWDEESTREL